MSSRDLGAERSMARYGGPWSPGRSLPAIVVALAMSIAVGPRLEAAGPRVLVTEVLPHTDPPLTDAIELHNATDEAVEIGGWWLTDHPENPRRFRIPPGTRLEPGGYLVFCQDSVGLPALPCEPAFFEEGNPDRPFALGAAGDAVYLFATDPATGELTGEQHGFAFGTSANGVSFGRTLDSLGEEIFPPQETLTLGGPNSGPRVGPLVISEILLRPEPGGFEFVELVNASDKTVRLRQSKKHDDATYRILGIGAVPGDAPGVADVCEVPEECDDFVFPHGTKVRSGGLVLLVRESEISPAVFRKLYGIPEEVAIFRYSGSLAEAGQLRLVVPETFDGGPEQLFIDLDVVGYGDWPSWGGREGFSMERRQPFGYGDDPVSWGSGPVPGGTPGFLPCTSPVP